MTPKEREALVRKIQGLFNLGDRTRNSSEAEAMAAISKAKELMRQHNLSLSEVKPGEDPKKQSWKMNRMRVSGGPKRQHFAFFEKLLAHAVDALAGTKHLLIYQPQSNGRKGVSLVFYGEEADVEIAFSLYHALLDSMKNCARARLGPGWTPSHRTYADAFMNEVLNRSKEKQQGESDFKPGEADRYALVIQSKKDALEIFQQQEFPNLKEKPNFAKGHFDPEAAALGKRDGRQVDLEHRKRLEVDGGTVPERVG